MKIIVLQNRRRARQSARGIRDMLMRQGFGKTLDYLCTFSAFSVLSGEQMKPFSRKPL